MKLLILIPAAMAMAPAASSATLQAYSVDEANFATILYKVRVTHELCKVSTAYLGDFNTRLDSFMLSHQKNGVSMKAIYDREKPLLALDAQMKRGFKDICTELVKKPPAMNRMISDISNKLRIAHSEAKH